MEIIRNHEYYDQFWDIFKTDNRDMKYHIAQAETYRDLYFATKGRKGFYRILNKFAEKRNAYHVEAGTKMAKKQLVILMNEMMELNKMINNG